MMKDILTQTDMLQEKSEEKVKDDISTYELEERVKDDISMYELEEKVKDDMSTYELEEKVKDDISTCELEEKTKDDVTEISVDTKSEEESFIEIEKCVYVEEDPIILEPYLDIERNEKVNGKIDSTKNSKDISKKTKKGRIIVPTVLVLMIALAVGYNLNKSNKIEEAPISTTPEVSYEKDVLDDDTNNSENESDNDLPNEGSNINNDDTNNSENKLDNDISNEKIVEENTYREEQIEIENLNGSRYYLQDDKLYTIRGDKVTIEGDDIDRVVDLNSPKTPIYFGYFFTLSCIGVAMIYFVNLKF